MHKYLLIIFALIMAHPITTSAQDSQPVTIEQHQRLISALRILNGKLKASEESQRVQSEQVTELQKAMGSHQQLKGQIKALKREIESLSNALAKEDEQAAEKQPEQSNHNIYSIILILLLGIVTAMLVYCVKQLREKIAVTEDELHAVKTREAELDKAVTQSVSTLEQEKVASIEKLQLQLASASKLLTDQFETASKSLNEQIVTKSKQKSPINAKPTPKEDPNQLNMFDELFE